MYLTDRDPTATASTAPSGFLRTVPGTVFALGTVSLITDVSSEMVTAVLPLYLVTALGLSPLGFGFLDGVYNGVGALVRLLGGGFADRGGRHKTVAVAGYGLSALCKPLLPLVHTLAGIGAVIAVDRTGKGLRTAPRDAMISLSSPPETRGRAFGVHRAMDTAGAMLGPIVAFLLLRAAPGGYGSGSGGYRAVFTVSFCVALLGVVVLVLFVPSRRRVPVERAPGPSLSLLRGAALRRYAGCAALLGLVTVSDSFVYLLLQRRLDLAVEWFPLLPLGTAGVFLLLAVPLGIVADRIGRRRVFVGGHVMLLAAYGVLLSPLHSGLLPAIVLALHGTFYAATDGVLPAAASRVLPDGQRAGGLALIGTGQALARFACSLGFGAAWTLYGYHTGLLLATAGLALATLWSWRVLNTKAVPGP